MSKDFDTTKGAFILVAIVIVSQMIMSLTVVGSCMYGRLESILAPDACKNAIQPILELFQMSFTAAIAFAGGRMSAPYTPPPKLPPERKDDNHPDH